MVYLFFLFISDFFLSTQWRTWWAAGNCRAGIPTLGGFTCKTAGVLSRIFVLQREYTRNVNYRLAQTFFWFLHNFACWRNDTWILIAACSLQAVFQKICSKENFLHESWKLLMPNKKVLKNLENNSSLKYSTWLILWPGCLNVVQTIST
jgi:hypothetical protein